MVKDINNYKLLFLKVSMGKYITADSFFRNPRHATMRDDIRDQREAEGVGVAVITREAYKSAGVDAVAWSEIGSRACGAEGREA